MYHAWQNHSSDKKRERDYGSPKLVRQKTQINDFRLRTKREVYR